MSHNPTSDLADPNESSATLRARIASLETRLVDLEALLEHFPGIIARFDRHHRHCFVSSSVTRATGLPAASFLGKTNLDLGMPTDLVSQWDAALEEVFSTGQPTHTMFDFPSAAGIQHYDSELVPEIGPDGTVTTVLGITRDVTDRVRAKEELRQHQALLQGLFDHAPTVILVKDRAGRHLMANRQLRSSFTRDPAQFIGTTAHDLFPPEVAIKMESNDQQVFATGQPLAVEEQVPIDGTLHTHLSVLFPIADSQGKINLLGLIATDITERKQMEAALRAQEAQLASERAFLDAVLEHVDEGVVASDAQGHVRFSNQALERITGYRRGGPVPPSLAALLAGGQQETPIDVTARSQVQNELRVLVNADGALRHVLVSQQWHMRDGQPLLVSSMRDVTAQRAAEVEQRRIEQKLQETQRLESLGRLAGGIAHDFNNLLAIILGNADLVLAGLPPDVPGRTSLSQITSAARQGADLARQMLIYAGRDHVLTDRIMLNEVIQNDQMLLEASIRKEARLHIDLAPELPPLLADLGQIRQVVMNLVVNASEAMGDAGGTISISTKRITYDSEIGADLPTGTYVQLTVHDTGEGIDPSIQEWIFDPFFTTRFMGRGLGLAVVRSIVERHRGRIHATSSPGQGATFTVYLPALIEPSVTSLAPLRSLRHGNLILVVDDEARVQRMAAAMLGRLGFTSILAYDGAAALAEVRAWGSELAAVLLDLTMPDMRGEEIFDAIRHMAPDLPVVVMDGYRMTDGMQPFINRNATGFLQKPFTLISLRAQLSALDTHEYQR